MKVPDLMKPFSMVFKELDKYDSKGYLYAAVAVAALLFVCAFLYLIFKVFMYGMSFLM